MLSLLGRVMNCGHQNLMAAKAVQQEVRRTADDKFAQIRFPSGVTEVRLKLESFRQGDDARCKSFGGERLVEGNIRANFAETREGQRRPDNFERPRLRV